MNPDDYIEGTHRSDHPANTNEIEVEFTDGNETLSEELKRTKERLNYKWSQLKRLAEIEQNLSTFGTITYEEQKEKMEILNMYL